MKRAETISSLLGEIGIPLAGFLFWNWDLYFILLFFLFDQLGRLFFIPKRLKGDIHLKNKTLNTIAIFMLDVLLVHALILTLHPKKDLWVSFWEFLSYEEWGIPQGAILIPLLFLSERMRLNTDLKLGRTLEWQNKHWKKTKWVGWLRLAFWGILLLVAFWFAPGELFVLLLFLGFVLASVLMVA
jgi:hypothetical protein